MRKPIILGKKTVSRVETLQDYADRHNCWKNYIIGVSAYYGFWAWLIGRLTRRYVVYYCIDFYCLEASEGWLDTLFIKASWAMDRFLIIHVDERWDISDRIFMGRLENYKEVRQLDIGVMHPKYYEPNKIVPCCYPPSYFRSIKGNKNHLIFVGLKGYGQELWGDKINDWIGGNLNETHMLNRVQMAGIGLALWKHQHNAYYGDSGKTKLYLACGIPVITVKWTTLSSLLCKTDAGICIDYDKQQLDEAIKKIQDNYDYYKNNVKKMWRYCNSDEVYKEAGI